MHSCVFCKIVSGEQPCVQLYADELVLAFLDIAPIHPGHTLIIPRKHHNSLTTVPPEVLERMMSLAPRLGQALLRSIDGVAGFNLFLANGEVAGQVVMHTHLHVIPRSPADGFSWGWRAGQTDDATRQAIADKVIRRLGQETP